MWRYITLAWETGGNFTLLFQTSGSWGEEKNPKRWYPEMVLSIFTPMGDNYCKRKMFFIECGTELDGSVWLLLPSAGRKLCFWTLSCPWEVSSGLQQKKTKNKRPLKGPGIKIWEINGGPPHWKPISALNLWAKNRTRHLNTTFKIIKSSLTEKNKAEKKVGERDQADV